MRLPSRWLFLASAAVANVAHGAPAKSEVSFRDQVAPILVKNCLGCHNEQKAAGGLNMATFALLRKGGKGAGGEILKPGDPEASGLVESVGPDAAPRMPYKLPPLTAAQVRTLRDWVEQGAKFDGPSEAETRIVSLVDPLRDLPRVVLRAAAADPVASLAFSPDGATLAAAVGRAVVLYDAATGEPKTTYAGHPGPLTSVRFTPDGARIVACGGRAGLLGSVTVWEVATSKRVAEARGHTDAILAAELSPDGRTLATAGYDRRVTLWSLTPLEPAHTLKDHTDAVYAVAFSPDGRTLASAGADRTVKLWDVASGRRGKTLSDATAELYAVTFGPGGSTVLAAGVDRSIRAWDVASADVTLVHSVFAHDAAVLRLVASADGAVLVSSGEDRGVKLWNLDTLAPRAALAEQPDWPQAVAIRRDGKRLAVGRYDGTAEVYDPASGKAVLTLKAARPAAAPPAARPELVRNASLAPPSPRGVTRGSSARLTLTGNGVGRAGEVFFDEPGLRGTIVPAGKPDPNRLEVDLSVAADARVGLHRVGVVTPLGVPGTQLFAVDAHPGVNETEPNDDPASLRPVTLPGTLLGAIDRPGDVDHFRFDAKKGQALVFALAGKALGSALNGTLALLDDRGKTLVESSARDGAGEPVVATVAPRDGRYTLRLTDADYGGSAGHFYRVEAGPGPFLASAFPLGVETGKAVKVRVSGAQGKGVDVLDVSAPPGLAAGELTEVPVGRPDDRRPVNRRTVVVADGPQAVENEPNDEAAGALALAVPGGASGRIGRDGDADHFRFDAKKGQRLVVEVFAHRLGTPLDPVIEILDARGRAVPRAVLRPVAETEVAFRDHNSTVTGIRLTKWNNLAVNDTVLIGREVTKIAALPRNPDDDCQFWGVQGRRIGLLETTPEHHAMAQPIYKVEVHAPGATFPAGGVPPVTLDYRNDDGGPGFDADSRLTFDPPADGAYVVRITDVRGLGGETFGYHLVVRTPRPDFAVSVSPENPNVPRGGTALVTVNLTRRDGFDAPVDVSAGGLPPGITASPARVERGGSTALLALSAAADAPAYSPPGWTVTARSGTSADELRHDFDPGGARGGRITVTPAANLKITGTPTRLVIRPGREAQLTLAVARNPAFTGRVPVEVRNLPAGVRVLNVGLNGVLITEKQAERTVTLYAEPWTEAGERPFFATGKAEAAGTEDSSPPMVFVVEPAAVSATR